MTDSNSMLFVSTVKEIKTKVYLKLQFKEFNNCDPKKTIIKN